MNKGQRVILVWAFAAFACLIILLPAWLYFFDASFSLGNALLHQRNHLNKILIPNGYVGWVYIHFNARSGLPMPIEGKYNILTVPPSADLKTATKLEEGFNWPWNADEYYYYSGKSKTHLKNTFYDYLRSAKSLHNFFPNDGGMIWGKSNLTQMYSNGHLETIESFFVGSEEQYKKFLALDEAIPNFDKIFQYNPDTNLSLNKQTDYLNLGAEAEALGPSHYQQAIAYYSNAIRQTKNSIFYRLRARVYNRSGQYKKALEDCNTALSQAAPSAEDIYFRAKAYKGLHQYRKAIDDCNKAIALETKNANRREEQFYFCKCRAESYLELADYKNALIDFTSAINLSQSNFWPAMREIYEGRAKCYEKLGQKELATNDLKTAVKKTNQ